MSETTDTLGKEWQRNEETGEFYQVRWMNEQETQERLELNVANTSSSLRQRVIDHLAGSNGHGGMLS
jgi:hypothetical protein